MWVTRPEGGRLCWYLPLSLSQSTPCCGLGVGQVFSTSVHAGWDGVDQVFDIMHPNWMGRIGDEAHGSVYRLADREHKLNSWDIESEISISISVRSAHRDAQK